MRTIWPPRSPLKASIVTAGLPIELTVALSTALAMAAAVTVGWVEWGDVVRARLRGGEHGVGDEGGGGGGTELIYLVRR